MNRFKEARQMAHLSQKTAALSLGVKPPSMSGWESGITRPTLENLVAMSSLYNVSVDFLLGVTDQPGHSAVQQKKQPTIDDDELRRLTVLRVQALPDQAFPHLVDFLDGLEAGRAIGSAVPVPPGSTPSVDP